MNDATQNRRRAIDVVNASLKKRYAREARFRRIGLGALLAIPACKEPTGPEREISGARLYAQNCASCHGPTGRGDGPLSAGLVPAPAKHADGNYMNPLTNDYLFRVVKEGGAAVGKSAMMAPWGTSMSDEEIRGLVAHMRTLAEPAYEGPMS